MIKRRKEGNGFNFFHFMIDLEGGPCVAKRLSGCGSGTEYLAVTPWGICTLVISSLEMKISDGQCGRRCSADRYQR